MRNISSLIETNIDANDTFLAVCIWPDPFEAPEVPTRDFLCAAVKHGVSEDVYEHLAGNVNCLRALKELSETECSGTSIAEALPSKSSALDVRCLEEGSIVAIAPNFKKASTRGIITGWNFRPVNVLIHSPIMHDGCSVPYIRGTVVTPFEDWVHHGSDSCRFWGKAQEWMLHLWLEFPVAIADICAIVDEVQDSDRVAVAIEAYARGLKLEVCDGVGPSEINGDNTPAVLERLRLYDRSKTLSETVDAYST